jgi:hypothetical protein
MGTYREGHLSCNQFGLKGRNIAYVRGHNLHRRCVLQLQNFRMFASFSVPETPSELPQCLKHSVGRSGSCKYRPRVASRNEDISLLLHARVGRNINESVVAIRPLSVMGLT